MKVGIEAAAIYLPKIYLPVKDLAIKRNIEPEKLEFGLGLKKMAVLDAHEDTATLSANVLLKLFKYFDLNPKNISRIYLGTESALDAAKPTATYAVQLVQEVLKPEFGENSFRHIDVLDMTFACVGGVDALHNCLDFVRVNPNKKAIVIAADYAKYALDSSGEYTQGAGAVAMLISANPELISFENNWGISTESVFDFFKPRRYREEENVVSAVNSGSNQIEIFTDEPIFDGQYSNECYKDRLRDAYFDLKKQLNSDKLFENWKYLAFHLPYAFQGKRMFTDIFALENELDNSNENQKSISKSDDYVNLINEKIIPTQWASSEIGNMYTASIFTALLSALTLSDENLEGKKVGFMSYGSGSKSKVFEGTIESGWKSVIEKLNLKAELEKRQSIDYETYENLHRKKLKHSVGKIHGFKLEKIENENPNLLGARYYSFQQ